MWELCVFNGLYRCWEFGVFNVKTESWELCVFNVKKELWELCVFNVKYKDCKNWVYLLVKIQIVRIVCI